MRFPTFFRDGMYTGEIVILSYKRGNSFFSKKRCLHFFGKNVQFFTFKILFECHGRIQKNFSFFRNNLDYDGF